MSNIIAFLNMDVFHEDESTVKEIIDMLNNIVNFIVISNYSGKGRGRKSRMEFILKKHGITTPLHELWFLPNNPMVMLISEISHWFKCTKEDKNSGLIIDTDTNNRIGHE